MSHFTRVRTQLRDLETVRQALADLGYEVRQVDGVRGYGGQQTKADLIVDTGSDYDVGFRRDGDEVVMVADLWGLKLDREKFLEDVTQRYAYLTVKKQAEIDGWQTVTEEVQVDGSIRLVLQRWS